MVPVQGPPRLSAVSAGKSGGERAGNQGAEKAEKARRPGKEWGIPTRRHIEERRQDLVTVSKKLIVIYEVACAWDPGVTRRERQKLAKYQELAADLAKQFPGRRVLVVPVVFGVLGSLMLEDTSEAPERRGHQGIMREGQRETLRSTVRLVKRSLGD